MKALQLQMKQKLCQNCEVSWSIYMLVVLFGIGSWVAVNGTWVELPVLVQHAPEGWKLPSIFAVVIQIANIGPLLHTVFNTFLPGKIRDVVVIYVILLLGIISCGLLGFLWKETGVVFGKEYSIALITLVFCVAFVDCTSSVTFLPFMAVFKKEYMSALFVGAGLSGLLPSLLALAQDIPSGGDPCANYTESNTTSSNTTSWNTSDNLNFGTNVFFFGLMLMMVVSLLAFVGLNTFSFVKRERIDCKFENDIVPREALAIHSSQEIDLKNTNGNDQHILDDGINSCTIFGVHKPKQIALLLVIQVWIHAFSNGVVPAIQPFACIPYGNNIYYLTLILSNVANPLSSLLFYIRPTTKIIFIALLSTVYSSFVAYILCVASLSTDPPLVENNVGAIIIVLFNVWSVAIVTYTKVAISTWMQKQGKNELHWAGIALQFGSFLGALIIFLCINVFNVFSQC